MKTSRRSAGDARNYIRPRPQPLRPDLSSRAAGGRRTARQSRRALASKASSPSRPSSARRCSKSIDPWLRALSDDELGAPPRPARGPRHDARRQLRPDDGSVRERVALGPRARRQDHPLRPDHGAVRRPPRARREMAGAGRASSGRPRRPWAARLRRRQNAGDREPSGFRQRRAGRPSARARGASESASIPATPFRSPRRRSTSPAASRRMCATST